jgi:hypothetical protein
LRALIFGISSVLFRYFQFLRLLPCTRWRRSVLG